MKLLEKNTPHIREDTKFVRRTKIIFKWLRRMFIVAAVMFFLIPLTLLFINYWYCTTIKPTKSIADIPCFIPEYVTTFPARGTCYWASTDWWRGVHVIWGRHKGFLEIAKWQYDLRITDGVIWSQEIDSLTPEQYCKEFLEPGFDIVDRKEKDIANSRYSKFDGRQVLSERTPDGKRVWVYLMDNNEFYIIVAFFPWRRTQLVHWIYLQ
jgi:hypothetical protein